MMPFSVGAKKNKGIWEKNKEGVGCILGSFALIFYSLIHCPEKCDNLNILLLPFALYGGVREQMVSQHFAGIQVIVQSSVFLFRVFYGV